MRSLALLLVLLVLVVPPAYAQFVGNWTATGNMTTGRTGHTATLIPNGFVLVAGGGYFDVSNIYNSPVSSELFNPSTGQWTAAGNMTTIRAGHTASLLQNGIVLVAGGSYPYGGRCELFNPSTGQWTATGNMTTERYGHTATLLQNGLVLVAGGYYDEENIFLSSSELFNPSTGQWIKTGNMTTKRSSHTATLLQNGLVLVAGGDIYEDIFSTCELFNPSTGNWTATGSMTIARTGHSATLLQNGLVLVAAGDFYINLYVPSSCSSSELFNPSTGQWTASGNMTTWRAGQTATLLPNGLVLVAGRGYETDTESGYNFFLFNNCEIFNSSTGQWTATGNMTTGRSGLTGTLLQNGFVLVAGGDYNKNPSTSELFTYEIPTSTPTPTATLTSTPTLTSSPSSSISPPGTTPTPSANASSSSAGAIFIGIVGGIMGLVLAFLI